MRILVLTCYDMLKLRKREVPVSSDLPFDEPIFINTGGTVWECIQELPPAYQKVLVLFYYEGFKAREIARILSLPLGTVLVQLSRGRSKLKDRLCETEGGAHCAKQTI